MRHDQFNVTIRINESGIYVCRQDDVRQDFGPTEVYYNPPFESLPVHLSERERKTIYEFRSRYPVRPSDPEVYA